MCLKPLWFSTVNVCEATHRMIATLTAEGGGPQEVRHRNVLSLLSNGKPRTGRFMEMPLL